MSINPREYDLGELRRMAHHRADDGEPPDGLDVAGLSPEGDEPVQAGSTFRAGLYRELLSLEAGADGLAKPYLGTIPDQYAGEHLVFEWLEFLLIHAGYQGAMSALDYYKSVGWLSADAADDLGDYLRGIDDVGTTETSELAVDDHMLSLVYVAKLAAMT